ncbi:MAG TPA: Hsp20/alpha crystallin family protein [Allosphingosinicella sp.]
MARELMPWGRDRSMRMSGEGNPMLSLRREMDRMLTDVLGGAFPSFGGNGRSVMAWPQLDVEDSDKEVRITAELPGMKEEDIDLRIEDGMLMLSGERKDERQDKERGYSERYYGHFERQIALPRGVDQDACNAEFRDGMLRITIPKNEEAAGGRKIPIKASAEG